MAAPLKEIGSTTARAVGSFRETVQDLLVPELRAIKVQIESLTQEMRLRNEQHQKSLDQLGQEMRLRDEQHQKSLDQLGHEMRLRDDNQTRATAELSKKLDFAIDIRERLAQVEARLPRQ